MLLRVLGTAAAAFVVYRLYKRAERAMLDDKGYLARAMDQDGEMIARTLEEAQRHTRDKEYDLAAEYFYYAYKLLGCDWDAVVGQVQSAEVLGLLLLKRGL